MSATTTPGAQQPASDAPQDSPSSKRYLVALVFLVVFLVGYVLSNVAHVEYGWDTLSPLFLLLIAGAAALPIALPELVPALRQITEARVGPVGWKLREISTRQESQEALIEGLKSVQTQQAKQIDLLELVMGVILSEYELSHLYRLKDESLIQRPFRMTDSARAELRRLRDLNEAWT